MKLVDPSIKDFFTVAEQLLSLSMEKSNLLIQEFVKNNELKDLSTITIKQKKKINVQDGVKKEDETVKQDIAVKEEKTEGTKSDKKITIKNLVNKTESEIDKIIDPLKTQDLKNILNNKEEE